MSDSAGGDMPGSSEKDAGVGLLGDAGAIQDAGADAQEGIGAVAVCVHVDGSAGVIDAAWQQRWAYGLRLYTGEQLCPVCAKRRHTQT